MFPKLHFPLSTVEGRLLLCSQCKAQLVLVESPIIEMPECLCDSRCLRVTFVSKAFVREASIVQRLSRCLRGTFVSETFI
jgi:hypothetical protein